MGVNRELAEKVSGGENIPHARGGEPWEEICNRYGMSFRFHSKNLNEVNLFEVDWKWTKNKLKVE